MTGPADKRPRSRWPWFAGALAVLLMVFVFLFFKDDPLDDFSDLSVIDSTPAPGGVATFVAWMTAAKSIDHSPISEARRDDPDFNDRIAGEAPWRAGPVAAILDANRTALAELLAADALGPMTLPLQKSIDDVPGYYDSFSEIGDLLGIAAAERRNAGDIDAAFDYVLAHLRTAYARQQQNSSLLGYIIGAGSTALVLRHLEASVDVDTPDRILERVAGALRQAADPIADLERSIRYEFALAAGALDKVKHGDFDPDWFDDAPPKLLFKRNRTHNNTADIYRAGLMQLAEPPADRPPWESPEAPEGLARLSGNAFGDHLTYSSQLLPVVVDQADKQFASHRLLETKVALLRFRAANGELPDRLDQLAPAYLAEPPSDPYDRRPLRYDPARGAAWSIGRNLKDEGGAPVAGPSAFDAGAPDPTVFVQP